MEDPLHRLRPEMAEDLVAVARDDALGAVVQTEVALHHDALRKAVSIKKGLELRQDLVYSQKVAGGPHAEVEALRVSQGRRFLSA